MLKLRTLYLWLLLSSTQAAIEDVAFCGDCYCAPESGEECPMDSMPQVAFSDDLLTTLKTITFENPISLSCNPFTDEGCVTEPPLEQGEACVAEIIEPGDTSQCPQGYSYR
jgi:hypothetical protein